MKSQPIIDKIVEKLQTIDASNRTTFLIFQFNFNASDGSLLKSFVLDLKDLKMYEGTAATPDSEITIGDEEFFMWATQQITYDELKANDKVQINGNLEAVMKLMDKFHK
ncbi:uncharacterized protein LOC129916797 [Episyrphus balteatus]|uniref:uncharacterized protein LOC129916797 n=1 Tax=Episyrphus balteatus TaxID=286459 RepID=UPI002484F2E9|nr:uncharacterized protein LOC129916797 [Episyrphus balteatus]